MFVNTNAKHEKKAGKIQIKRVIRCSYLTQSHRMYSSTNYEAVFELDLNFRSVLCVYVTDFF